MAARLLIAIAASMPLEWRVKSGLPSGVYRLLTDTLRGKTSLDELQAPLLLHCAGATSVLLGYLGVEEKRLPLVWEYPVISK